MSTSSDPCCFAARIQTGYFPEKIGQPKQKLHFSKQITVRIQKTTGLQITVHQFRHAAAAIWLKHHPGAYEHIHRVLGHRNLTTTVKFYCGLETIAATDDFAENSSVTG